MTAKAKAVVKPKPKVKPAKATVTKPAPRKKASAPKPQRPEILTFILKTLDDAKAEDVTELSLIGKNPMTDYMVVASGRSQRHVQSTAELLAQKLRAAGFPANVEGLGAGDWVLVDALDVVIHLFRPEVRAFYNLEQMWMDEPSVQAAS